MCYDRTSVGKKPMCATVCPSGALSFGTREEMARVRQERPTSVFTFGSQTVKTKVQLMVPKGQDEIEMDIAALMGPLS
jgi:Fe-S-cluster-containing dehydrogenase component